MNPMHRNAIARLIARIALWTVLLAVAMLLPYLPGRYDPVAASLSTFATVAAFGSLVLALIGAAWLISNRDYALARSALVAASFVAGSAALATAASGSLATAALVATIALLWIARLWRRVRTAQAGGARLPRALPVTLIVIPLAATGTRMALVESVAAWSRDRAIANAATLIADIERFHERNGVYPAAISSVWPDYHPGIIGIERYRYEPGGGAYNLYFEHPSTELSAREIVMFNPRGEQAISSHAFDLLRLPPEEIGRQRGHFASHALRQPNWMRFLFD